jgi:hypothetical protein
MGPATPTPAGAGDRGDGALSRAARRRIIARMWRRARLAIRVACGAMLAACDSDDSAPPAEPPPDDPPPVVCSEDEVVRQDGCFRPGVPDGECGEGFTSVAGGACAPVLPAPCAPGQLAVPGDAACREVAPCGDTPFGEAGRAALFVDADAPAGGDGSQAAPLSTIGAAIEAAADGDVIAVAAGSYVEDLIVEGKSVEIVGRCPAMVEVVGEVAALQIKPGAGGTRVARLALTGDGYGAVLSGAVDVRLEQLWVHDLGGRGVDIEDPLGPTSAVLADSLIEGSTEHGLYIAGADVVVQRSNVRATGAGGVDGAAAGVVAFGGETGAPASVAVEGSVVSDNEHTGLYAENAVVALRRSVVERTTTVPDTGVIQGGVEVRGTTAKPGSIDIEQSVLRADSLAGLILFGATATVRASSIVGGQGSRGRGIELEPLDGLPSSIELVSSAIVDAIGAGVVVGGSSARIEGSVVRGVLLDGLAPQAFGVSSLPAEGLAATVEIADSLVAGCQGLGVSVTGSVVMERSRVRANVPSPDGTFGRGVEIHFDRASGAVSSAVLRDVSIEDNHDIGLLVVGATAELDGVVVRRTRSRADGRYGDGLAVISPFLDLDQPSQGLIPTTATLRGSTIEDNARAGVLNFSGSLTVQGSTIRCNAIDLDGEVHGEVAFDFSDGGGNVCGCGDAEPTCQVQSSALEVPEI